MSEVKKLAGQTLWYGVPTIASRFLGYLLSVLLFRWFGPVATADITQVYAIIPFLNIIYTYGLETAYFRYATLTNEQKLFNTLSTSLIVSILLLSAAVLFFYQPIAHWATLSDHPEYIRWMAYILFFDTLSVIPFARLRQQERPRKYAAVKLASVVITVVASVFFLKIAPDFLQQHPNHWLATWYNPTIGIGYYILCNAGAALVVLLLLWREWKGFRFSIDGSLWKEVLNYAYPLIIVGLGGMINEMLSRLVYARVLGEESVEAKRQLGVFGASYKIAVLITIFIQVFRMAAEPFFFKQSKQKNAPQTYARIMQVFVLATCVMWLGIALNLDWLTKLAYGKNFDLYKEGNVIIPILAMGSVFLGIYYNLTIWYKLTGKTWAGAWITIGGALLTVVLNFWWIPRFGFVGSAWATFFCYFGMMVISAWWGQKHYPVPYNWSGIAVYILLAAVFYLLFEIMRWQVPLSQPATIAVGAGLLVLYMGLFARQAKKLL